MVIIKRATQTEVKYLATFIQEDLAVMLRTIRSTQPPR